MLTCKNDPRLIQKCFHPKLPLQTVQHHAATCLGRPCESPPPHISHVTQVSYQCDRNYKVLFFRIVAIELYLIISTRLSLNVKHGIFVPIVEIEMHLKLSIRLVPIGKTKTTTAAPRRFFSSFFKSTFLYTYSTTKTRHLWGRRHLSLQRGAPGTASDVQFQPTFINSSSAIILLILITTSTDCLLSYDVGTYCPNTRTNCLIYLCYYGVG